MKEVFLLCDMLEDVKINKYDVALKDDIKLVVESKFRGYE
jgi:hypothetical protein